MFVATCFFSLHFLSDPRKYEFISFQFELQSIRLYCEISSADEAELGCCELPGKQALDVSHTVCRNTLMQ